MMKMDINCIFNFHYGEFLFERRSSDRKVNFMLKKEKYLRRDDTEVVLEKREELEEYLDFRQQNDVVYKIPIDNLRVFGMTNIPLFAQQTIDDYRFNFKGYEMPVVKADYDLPEVKECLEESGIFLILQYEDNKNYMLPTNFYSFSHILQRTDDFCGTMARTECKQAKKILSPEEKAERLNRDFDLYSDECLVLVRDRKVRAVHSRVYKWLDNKKLIDTFEKVIKEDNEDLSFSSAEISHEYVIVNYLLNNELVEDSLRLQLNDHGSNIKEIKAGVRFVTSDIGMSAVRAQIYLIIDDNKITLNSIYMEHKGDVSVEKFEELLSNNFAALLKESEERIEELGNTDITNIPFVVREIVENNTSVFPKKIAEEVIAELEIQYPVTVGGTAIDCYLALNEIINRHANTEKCGLNRYLALADSVAGMINLPYEKIEKGNYYKKS